VIGVDLALFFRKIYLDAPFPFCFAAVGSGPSAFVSQFQEIFAKLRTQKCT